MSKWQEINEYIQSYHAQLIAVSKNQENIKVLNLHLEGQLIFAENRPQELVRKSEEIKAKLKWHLIGHLQTNKVKSILPITELIHSVDSIDLLIKINQEAEKVNKIQKILLQLKLSNEETKHGFDFDNLRSHLDKIDFERLSNITFCGVMGIGSLTDDPIVTRQEFKRLYDYFNHIKEPYLWSKDFKEISMGMSSDYKIALDEGATMVRIGSLLFN